MKKTKLLSILTAAAMSVCMIFGTASVNAVDDTTETSDKTYTLEELFAMNDEEFLALKGAQSMYKTIKRGAESIL